MSKPLRVTTIARNLLWLHARFTGGLSDSEDDVITPVSKAKSGSESVGVSETEMVVLVESSALSFRSRVRRRSARLARLLCA